MPRRPRGDDHVGVSEQTSNEGGFQAVAQEELQVRGAPRAVGVVSSRTWHWHAYLLAGDVEGGVRAGARADAMRVVPTAVAVFWARVLTFQLLPEVRVALLS